MLKTNEVFMECVKDGGGIVSVVTASKEGLGHVANTWNKYLIVDEDKILMPCFGFRKTEKNLANNSYTEVIIGSDKVQGKMGMGTGFLLTGKAEILKDGEDFERMHDKCDFANRVLIFRPENIKQTI